MPIIKPRKLTPRGVFAHLLPNYFRSRKHPHQSLKGDAKTIKVPWDADELFDRIKFKEKKFRASVMTRYEFGNSYGGHQRPKDSTWCVATGCFAPRPQTIATHIFPPALGSNVNEFISGTREIWSPVNGLMLPKPVHQAMEDWALMIVPSGPLEAVKTYDWDYKFRVMDTKHPSISKVLYQKQKTHDLPELTTGQLDEKQLLFGNTYRPKDVYFYLQSCCAVWKKTYLDNPECDDEADFTARFLGEISQYWHPEYVERSKVTAILLFKCKDAEFSPPKKTKTAKAYRRLSMEESKLSTVEPATDEPATIDPPLV